MTVLATIAIDSDKFDLGEVLSGYDTQIELTQFVPIDDSLVPYFWADNHDFENFESAVRDDPRVQQLTSLNGTVGRRLYNVEWSGEMDGFLTALDEHEILIESATGTDSEWEFHLRAHNREPLAAFQAACREHDIPLQVRRVHHNPDDPTVSYGLSEKQREAVILAVEHGYFDVPREHSLTDLAEELDISRQAFSRRLQRGLHSVLINTVLADANI